MYATYLFIQLVLVLAFYLLLYIVEAFHWAKVRVRVRSQDVDYDSRRNNNRYK